MPSDPVILVTLEMRPGECTIGINVLDRFIEIVPPEQLESVKYAIAAGISKAIDNAQKGAVRAALESISRFDQ